MRLTFSKGIGRNEIFCQKGREKIGRATIVFTIFQDHVMTPDGM